MFKRVMIVVISVLAMIFLALLLTHLPHFDYRPVVSLFQVSPKEKSASTRDVLKFGDEGMGAASGIFEVHVRDRQGRLKQVIRARMKPRADSGIADLVDPEFLLYNERGEQLSIRAPGGYIDSQGAVISQLEDIRRGALTGGVVLRQDRGTPDDPSDDLVARTDHVDYDQETSRLSTDDPVTVRSPEEDIDAIGMRIFLVPGKSELREMHFLKDVHIVMRRQSERFRLGLSSPAAGPAPGASERPSPPAAGARSPSAGAPARGPSAPAGTEAAPGAAGPATPQQAAPGGTLYRFVLKGNVRAVSGDQSLDADEVILFTRAKGGDFGGSRSKKSPSGAPDATAPGQPSAGPGGDVRQAAPVPAATPPAPTPAARREASPPVVPLDIVCDGPFIVAPVPGDERREFQISATGERVVLVDGEMRATGAAFEYDGAAEAGVLRGGRAGSVEIVQGSNRVTGDVVKFDRRSGAVQVEGRGRLDSESSATGLAFGAGPSKEPFVATWTRHMNVAFVSRRITDRSGRPADRSFFQWAKFSGDAVLKQGAQSLSGKEIAIDFYPPSEGGRQGIRKVVADGQVAASQPAGGEGGTAVGDLACEHLVFDFTPTEDGGSRPGSLHARGQVVGAQPTGGIEAEELRVAFAPDPKDAAKTRAVGLVADGNVRVRRSGLYAEAEHMETDETGDSILLRGTERRWAMATRAPHKISGREIVMSRKTQRVDVAGPGSLDLMSERGLEGQRLKEPMPLHIDWKRAMFFDGAKNLAHFSGAARTRTPTASVDCEDLWAFFADAQAEAGTGAAPAGPAPDGPAGGDPAEKLFRGKNVVRLVAIEKVLARTVETPADPKSGLNVATLRGEKLEYNAEEDKAYVPGPGTLEIAVVPREPAATPPHQRRPESATTVAWKKAMIFERAGLVAWFGEDVVAQARGRGASFVDSGGREGRTSGDTTLKCQDLRLFFVNRAARSAGEGTPPPPAPPDRPAPPAESGPGRSVAIDKLVASADVWFRDGDRQARAQRLTYDRSQEVVILTGRQGVPAEIWQESELKQQFNRLVGEKVAYWRHTGNVEIVGPQGISITPSRSQP